MKTASIGEPKCDTVIFWGNLPSRLSANGGTHRLFRRWSLQFQSYKPHFYLISFVLEGNGISSQSSTRRSRPLQRNAKQISIIL